MLVGSYQACIGKSMDFSMSQHVPTVSKVLSSVTEALSHLENEFIYFPKKFNSLFIIGPRALINLSLVKENFNIKKKVHFRIYYWSTFLHQFVVKKDI